MNSFGFHRGTLSVTCPKLHGCGGEWGHGCVKPSKSVLWLLCKIGQGTVTRVAVWTRSLVGHFQFCCLTYTYFFGWQRELSSNYGLGLMTAKNYIWLLPSGNWHFISKIRHMVEPHFLFWIQIFLQKPGVRGQEKLQGILKGRMEDWQEPWLWGYVVVKSLAQLFPVLWPGQVT